jgi:hypothetical protein
MFAAPKFRRKRLPLHHWTASSGPPPRDKLEEDLGADDPASDFATICDEEGLDQRQWHFLNFCLKARATSMPSLRRLPIATN